VCGELSEENGGIALNCIDVIFFQAELAPEKRALIAPSSVVTYGRVAQSILSAQQRLHAAGLTEGQTVGLYVVRPIEHFILACALYRMRVASATITNALDSYLEHVPFDVVLADSILPTVRAKQPAARMLLVEPSWFQDQVAFSVAQRTSSRRDPAPDWVSRITCLPDEAMLPPVVKTTSRSLERQLLTYNISAPANWERMVLVAGLDTNTGFLQALSALWLGRSVCFADLQSVRHLISLYKHDYLVASTKELESLLALQETHFIALHALRAACFEGRVSNVSTIVRSLATISSNLLFRYVRPEIGIVAYGDTAPVAAEKEGALRLRLRDEALAASAREHRATPEGWIYPQQRAKLMSNNLLVMSA
jgi:hypothetical protein